MSDKPEQENIHQEEILNETPASSENKDGLEHSESAVKESAKVEDTAPDTDKAVSETAASNEAADEPHEETEEEMKARLKREKNDRMHKNLRILGIVLACYYFFSAGLDYYQQKKAEALMLNQEASNVFEKGDFIKSTLDSSLALFADKGLAFASYGADGAVVTNDGLARVANDIVDGKVLSSTFTTTFDKTLSSESQALFYSFLGSIENTSDTSALMQMARRMGADDGKSEMSFKDGMWTTAKAQYSMTVGKDGPQKTLSVKAEPLNNMPTN